MRTEELAYASATGLGNIYAKLYLPDSDPRAVVQLAHGMAEHIARYDAFAQFLCGHGLAVAANDHAGHGKSADQAHKGYFGESNGWDAVVKDMKALHDIAVKRFPGVPYVLFGHSMGSFLARSYAARYKKDLSMLILSGTAGANPILGIAKILAKNEKKKNGPMQPSKRINDMSFGSYNKRFLPARTPFDWLSTDTAVVDRYIEDPWCGFPFTAEAYYDVFTGLSQITGPAWAQNVPYVPILLLSGAQDPVGNAGRGVRQVEQWLKDTGHNVTCKLYPEGRHEMLNERNHDEVYADALAFIEGIL